MNKKSSRGIQLSLAVIAYPFWIVFAPSKYMSRMAQMGVELTRSLADIFDNKRNRRINIMFFIVGYLVAPLMLSICLQYFLGHPIVSTQRAFLIYVYALVAAIVIGIVVDFLTGIWSSILIVLVATYSLASIEYFAIHAFLGFFYPSFFGMWAMSCLYTSGLKKAYVSLNLTRSRLQAILVGAPSLATIALIIFTSLIWGRDIWDSGLLDGKSLSVISGFEYSVFTFPVIYFRGLSIKKSFLGAILLGTLFGLFTFQFITSTGFEDDMYGIDLLGTMIITTLGIYCQLFSLPYVVGSRLAGEVFGAIVATITGGVTFLLLVLALQDTIRSDLSIKLSFYILLALAGLTQRWWRPLICYLPELFWSYFLSQRLQRGEINAEIAYYRHPLYWDEQQWLPFFGLDQFLKLVFQESKTTFNLILQDPNISTQTWAIRNTLAQIDAEKLGQTETIEDVSKIHSQANLTRSDHSSSPVIQSFNRISQDVAAALAQSSTYNQRLALLKISGQLNTLHKELLQTNTGLSTLFRSISLNWQEIISNHEKQLNNQLVEKQEIQNPYVIGVPLSLNQEIFIGRKDISDRLEKLILDNQHPPLLLYGQRRMGKTSLLNNLASLLPNTIVPLFVDLQGPVSLSNSNSSFLYNLGRQMTSSAQKNRELKFPKLARGDLETDPFTVFDQWLDDIEDVAITHNSTLLMALDEFEILHDALEGQILDETAILGFLRHTIQHRPRIKILLAGSHTIEEFERWATYFINAQIIHLGHLNLDEAIQLIEKPVVNFELRYQPEALTYILELTNGHPYLIQLLCYEIVLLKNRQKVELRLNATVEDVQQSATKALDSGRLFFADIERNQLSAESVDLLKWLVAETEEVYFSLDLIKQGDFLDVEKMLRLLESKEILRRTNESYHFESKLIRMWFSQK